MYICECGEEFEEVGEDAYAHVLSDHLDLVEVMFEEFIEDGTVSEDEADELYEDALYEVTDDLLDEIVEE